MTLDDKTMQQLKRSLRDEHGNLLGLLLETWRAKKTNRVVNHHIRPATAFPTPIAKAGEAV